MMKILLFMKWQNCLATTMLWLGVAGCLSAPIPAAPERIRVMTYNIHHGEGLDGKVDLARIATLITNAAVDIVALQEVDKGVERTGRRDLPAELAALTGLTCVFSNNYHYQGGEYGNAVLTRFPVRHATNHLFQMIRAREQRGLLQLVLRVRDQELVFWNTHLDAGSDDAERWAAVAEITALAAASASRPFLLCGDFNAVPTSRVAQQLAGQFDDVWARVGKGAGGTVPVGQPNRRIDYFWIGKNQQLIPKSAWLIQSEASDHLPVVAELEISGLNPP
jgi:endonuclease/exonuclease/phosphatase family metal-dependent hydrolase